MHRFSNRSRSHRGFTLVEVVVAIGIFALGLLTVAALLRPALDTTRENIVLDSTIRVTGGIEALISERSFEDVYGWVRDGVPIIAYTIAESSGEPEGFQRTEAFPATDVTELHSSIGADASGSGNSGTSALEGSLFIVELRISPINREPLSEIQGTYADPQDYPHSAIFLDLHIHEAVPGSGFESQTPRRNLFVYRYQFSKHR